MASWLFTGQLNVRRRLSQMCSTDFKIQVTWLVVTEVRSESFGLVTERRHYNERHKSCCDSFSSSSVVPRVFSALYVYWKFGHHPYSLGYLCAKFRFCRGLLCWASPWRKSSTQSLNQSPSLFDAPETEAFNSEFQPNFQVRHIFFFPTSTG